MKVRIRDVKSGGVYRRPTNTGSKFEYWKKVGYSLHYPVRLAPGRKAWQTVNGNLGGTSLCDLEEEVELVE